MSRGVIKRLVRDKGFGFIQDGEDGRIEYFFHRSTVSIGRFEDMNEGDAVTFDVVPSSKGPRAEHVDRA